MPVAGDGLPGAVAGLGDLRSMAPDPEAREKVRLLRSFDPDAVDLNIPDPYYGGKADFEEVRELIEAAAPSLLNEIQALKSRR